MKAVLVLPTYNERDNITTLLTRLANILRTVDGFSCSVLVIDDQSPDGTQEVIRTWARTHTALKIKIISKKKEGLGRALLTGMIYAVDRLDADVVLQMDADLSHDPGILPRFFDKMRDGAEFVVGSRYIPGGSIPSNWGIHRKVFSIIGNAIVRFGLGFPKVHDWTGGYRAYKRQFIELYRNQMRRYSGYVFQIAFLHKAVRDGAVVQEVPIHFTDRRYGRSKIAPSRYIRDVLAYVWKQRINQVIHGHFGKFAVVGTIGFIINTVILESLVYAGFHPALGSGIGAELAILSNFVLNNAWTFREKKIKGRLVFKKIFQFNITSLGAIIIQAGTVWIGSTLFGTSWYRLYYILGVGIGLIWNYTMYSRVIWKTK